MTGREESELQYLERYYEKSGSQLIILYGQKNTGLEELAEEFCKDRPHSFYCARPCAAPEQLRMWGEELLEAGVKLPDQVTFTDLFEGMYGPGGRKKVFVIWEFQHIVRQNPDFMEELVRFLHTAWNTRRLMVLLCSTSIGWVENSMVQKIGMAATSISGFLKVKEKNFSQLCSYFPKYSKIQQVELYGVLGGFPGLWQYFDKSLSVRDNLCANVLGRDCYLHEEALRFVTRELRETNVYHTILTALAGGKQKLNDLFLQTGFSRAKISVYLKNLMELELVEKVFSYDTAGRENAQKGIYRIKNRLVHFYFRYVYPHMSRLFTMTPEAFYEKYVKPDFARFTASIFSRVCREYIAQLSDAGKLPFSCARMGEWVGKTGDIDIVAQDGEGLTLIGLCSWGDVAMSYEDYEWLLFCARKAKLRPDYVYLFSSVGFDGRLMGEAKKREGVQLFDLCSI